MEWTRDTVTVDDFTFECGESLPELDLAYETYGSFDGDNAVLVCHALTGSAHVADAGGLRDDRTDGQARAWWDDIVGSGKAIDTDRYYVVCVNVPGSCYGTTGPSSEGPDGDPYGTDFPPVTVRDWTRAQRQVLDHLGVGRLHAVVGGSVGGMNALDWASGFPDDAGRVAAIAATARLNPQSLAFHAIARRAITSDPGWQDGDYYGETTPDDGLKIARQLGHVLYLSRMSMWRRFGRRSAGREASRDAFPSDPAADFFPYRDVESFLDYNATKFADRFDANSYLYLTRATDEFDLSAGHASDAAALAAFGGDALVMSFTADWHFPVDEVADLADAFRTNGTPVAHHVIESDHGHDAFLVEPEKVGPPLRDFLDDGVEGGAVVDAGGDAGRGTGGPPASEGWSDRDVRRF
jgi:homoserine O-acetyltransferase